MRKGEKNEDNNNHQWTDGYLMHDNGHSLLTPRERWKDHGIDSAATCKQMIPFLQSAGLQHYISLI